METIARIFIIPSRQNQFIQENVFNKTPIRRIAVAMNTNLAVVGSFHENPFNYQQFHLRELRIIRGGRAIFSLDIIYPCRPFVTKMKAMQFNEEFSVLPMKVFVKPLYSSFRLDFTTGCSWTVALSRPKWRKLEIRNIFFFILPLEQITEVIILGQTQNSRWKYLIFLSFQIPIKLL